MLLILLVVLSLVIVWVPMNQTLRIILSIIVTVVGVALLAGVPPNWPRLR